MKEPDSAAAAPGRLHCTLCYALPEHQYLWLLELPAGATVADAIAAARACAFAQDASQARVIPWDSAPTGVFGEPRERSEPLVCGDRVELYRPLTADPRERRRERLRASGRNKMAGK